MNEYSCYLTNYTVQYNQLYFSNTQQRRLLLKLKNKMYVTLTRVYHNLLFIFRLQQLSAK